MVRLHYALNMKSFRNVEEASSLFPGTAAQVAQWDSLLLPEAHRGFSTALLHQSREARDASGETGLSPVFRTPGCCLANSVRNETV